MKRKTVLATVLGLALVTASYGLVQAHGGSGGGWFGMGFGHMGGSGWGHMGSTGALGFDGTVYGHNHHWRSERPLNSDQARDLTEHTLGHNPYLKVGAVIEGSDRFEVEIVTSKSNELVNRLLVEKDAGWVSLLEN